MDDRGGGQQGGEGQAERGEGASQPVAQGRSHRVGPPPNRSGRVAQRRLRMQGPTTWRTAISAEGTGHTMKLVGGSLASSNGRSIRKRSSSPAEGVAPSTISSARIRPISEANLKAWAAPRATSTAGWSGNRSRTKSRSGGIVYRQVLVRISGPTLPGRWL